MKRSVILVAFTAALIFVLSSSEGFAQCCGGTGSHGVKTISSAPAGGGSCSASEATKAALGGDGEKDAKAKSACPACAAAGKMCAKCEKAALGGEGIKDAKTDKTESACPVCASGRACAVCAVKKAAKASKAEGKEQAAFFGNKACPIMGGKTDPKLFVAYQDPKTHTYANIYMCCPGCADKIKSDPAAAYQKAYLGKEVKNSKGKVLAKKGEPIALNNKTCPITGDKVAPAQFVTYDGVKVGLCCPACEKAFMKSPDKHLAALVTKAAKAKKETR